jgi:gamma-F420-2:alpha-L-glutamate ligase
MKHKGWLIYSEQDANENESYINWYIEESKKQDLQIDLVLREKLTIGISENKHMLLVNNRKVTLPGFAIVRTIEPLLSLQLEQLGIAVFNSSKVADICNHKGKTYYEIAKLGIPMVDTYFAMHKNLTKAPPMSYPFVIKEVSGRGGKQVYFIKTLEHWHTFFESSSAVEYVIQSTNVQLGKDLRVFVIGNEIIGAVLRESNDDFRSNYKLGGKAIWYELNPTEEKVVRTIIQHFEFGLVGIDFLFSSEGELLFNEIEDVVGSRTLSAVSDINIVERYISFIKTKISLDA